MIRLIISIVVFVLIGFSLNAQIKDVPNKIDSLGLKQGLWIELEAKPNIIGITHYDLSDGTSKDKFRYDYSDYVVLKYVGSYINGLRQGKWDVYSPNDKIRYTINYKGSIPCGEFMIYHLNGEVELKGFIARKKFTKVSYYGEKGKYIKEENWYTSGLVERLNR